MSTNQVHDFTEFISALLEPNENERYRELDAEVAEVLDELKLRNTDEVAKKDSNLTGTIKKRRRRQKIIAFNGGAGIGLTVSDSDDQDSLYYYDPPYVQPVLNGHSSRMSYVTPLQAWSTAYYLCFATLI
jgi:hypothetical protein